MFGMITGDITGLVYEYHNVKRKDFTQLLMGDFSTYDTFLTVALVNSS